MSNVKQTLRRALPYLTPVINERKAKIREHGLVEGWPGKPVSHAIKFILSQIIIFNIMDRWLCRTTYFSG